MLDRLYPPEIGQTERISITGYLVCSIFFVLYGISQESPVFMVVPLLPILYYLVTSNVLSGIFLLVIGFPFSIMYAVPGARLGIQLPTEPLIVAFLGFWILHQIMSHNKGYPLNKYAKYVIGGYILYFTALFLSVLVSDNLFSSAKLFIATLCYSAILVHVLNHEVDRFSTVEKLLTTLFVITIILVTYTLSRHVAHGLTHHYSNFAPWPFYNEHGSYGAFLAIVFSMSFCIVIFNKWGSKLTTLSLITASVTFVGVIFSFARAAWLSVVALLLFLLIIRLKHVLNFKVIALLFLIGIGISTIYVRIEINEELEKSITSITDVQRDISNLERINRWMAAWNMFQSHKLLGVGYGNYLFKYQEYRDYRFTTPISDMFAQAHSEYFQHLAETGIMGFLSWLTFLFLLFFSSLKIYAMIDDPYLKSILLGALGGVLTYQIHGFFNGFLQFDKVAVPYWLSVGICLLIITKWRTFQQQLFSDEPKTTH